MTAAQARLLLAVVLVAPPAEAAAQVRASEPAVVAQTVDGTTLTIEYYRPRVRGREVVYGGLMPWGEVWTPGANYATTLEVNHDITINGHAVKQGKYSVWMELQPKEWTLILDPKAKRFHTEHPKPDSSQVRFPVTPANVKGPEVLTWFFPAISATGTTLQMAWAGKSVALEVVVPQSHPLTLAADLAPRYTGSYAFAWTSGDPTEAPSESAAPPSTWAVRYDRGMLLADWEGPPFPDWAHLVLIRIADNWFIPGTLVDGELFDVFSDLVIEFDTSGGPAAGFGVRGEDDEVLAKGVRAK